MKNLLLLIAAVFLCSGFIPQKSFAQKTSERKIPVEIRSGKMLKNQENRNRSSKRKINAVSNSKRKKNTSSKRGSYLLSEDFESGIVPPADWSSEGTWDSYAVSAYGNGDYSAFYENYFCPPNNALTTPYFNPSGGDDTLIFDIAYASYLDGEDSTTYTDAMTIYYSTDDGKTYTTLILLPGDSMKTSPARNDYFVPVNEEWKQLKFVLPAGTNRIQFYPESACGNNLFIDNVIISSSDVVSFADAEVERAWAKGKLPLFWGVPDTIMASIKNTGNVALSNLKVYLNVTGAYNLSDSAEIPVLSPGSSVVVSFRGIIPVISGYSNVSITIPADDDNGNNQKTTYTQSNLTSYSYVDSNCCNSGAGFGGEAFFLTRYRMNNTGQVRKVNVKIYNDPINIGQVIYGVVMDQNGVLTGRSQNYQIKNSDLGNYKTFDITDPKPFVTSNSDFYVGLAQPQVAGPNTFFVPQQMDVLPPARPLTNYSSNIVPVGTAVGNLGEFPVSYGFNWAIQCEIGSQLTTDAGVANLGLTYDQYFTSATFNPVGKVFNAGTGSATFTVNRKITPGGYTSTKSVTGLASGSAANVTFDPWTFTSGTVYTIRDSVILAGDGNISNNSMSNIITPRIAKQLAVLWQTTNDKDSLVRAIIADGRYAGNYDTIPMYYTGSYRPWKILFSTFKDGGNWASSVRDSLKSFIDNSTAGNKKTLVVFGNKIDLINDPNIAPYGTEVADTIFYRQYLKSFTFGTNWPASIPSSQNKFRGIGFFDGISQDSVSDPGTPGLIRPANGSSAAFKPMSVSGNDNDSCNAVSFAGANYNTFFMTNEFSSLRSTGVSPTVNIMGPVRVYTKIIDWIQSVNTGAKALDLTVQLEGFYNSVSNTMISDTMRVYLRSSVNPFPKVDSAKAYLNAAGQGSFIFNNISNGTPYYIQLKHRSGLETWSKTTQSFSSNHLTYNFTSDSAKSFGNNMKKQGSKWVVYGGDVNQDGFVDLTDVIAINNNANVFTTGYIKTDVNGDNFTDLTDVILAYNNSSIFAQRKTPLSEPQLLAEKKNEQDLSVQNPAAQNSEYISEETGTDHEIYDRFKNEHNRQSIIPELIYFNKGNSKSIIKGRK